MKKDAARLSKGDIIRYKSVVATLANHPVVDINETAFLALTDGRVLSFEENDRLVEVVALSGQYNAATVETDAPADNVNHPTHYTSHPSGIECIQVTEHMNFNIGNAVKYLWRTDEKGDPIENLKKAAWYVSREIERRGKGATK